MIFISVSLHMKSIQMQQGISSAGQIVADFFAKISLEIACPIVVCLYHTKQVSSGQPDGEAYRPHHRQNSVSRTKGPSGADWTAVHDVRMQDKEGRDGRR